jgi:hypothetical protein
MKKLKNIILNSLVIVSFKLVSYSMMTWNMDQVKMLILMIMFNKIPNTILVLKLHGLSTMSTNVHKVVKPVPYGEPVIPVTIMSYLMMETVQLVMKTVYLVTVY